MVNISKGINKQRFAVNYENAMNEILTQDPGIPLREAVDRAKNTAEEITKIQAAYVQDPIFYRTAMILLASIILLVVLGGLILTYMGKNPSEGILAIGATAVGALAGIFSAQK